MDKKDTSELIWMLMARKLSGEATPAELEELADLLRANPELNYSREIMHDIWKSKVIPDRQYAENKYKELVRQMQSMGIDEGKFSEDEHYINWEKEKKRIHTKKLWYSIAAALVVLVGGYLFFTGLKKDANAGAASELAAKNEISTKNGSKSNLILPDGTKVWLNAGSKLTYDKSYGNTIREVQLSGEGFFDVVKNAAKPFIIHTTTIDVKVLGTQFNVKCYPGEKTTETSLIRGRVEVTLKDRHEKIMMKPNEKLVVNNEAIAAEDDETGTKKQSQTVKAVNKTDNKPIISLSHITFLPSDSSTVIETAWVKNRLVFSSESFEEVALKMERWYNTQIDFASEDLKNVRLTGNFEKETIADALTALQLTTRFSYTLKNDRVTISRK
ncbi:MAG: FecR family protein [Ferruginibacter sp.]